MMGRALATRNACAGRRRAYMDCVIMLSARDRAVLANARDAGIGNGLTIPANVPGETNGSCSFAMAEGQELESEQLPLVQLVGAFAFESARCVLHPILRADDEAPRLTDRQLECVVLIARGKTDWEISRILGVSHETVIQHIKDARDRYGVTKRTTLAIRALFDSSISFANILSR